MADKNYQLVVRKGPQLGQVIPLSSESMSIGRDPMSDITISDPEVSRYHAQLLLTDAGFQIQDMGSTNGTFIDGEHLGGQPALLTSGQTIQLGSGVVLAFEAVPEGDDVMATVAETSPDPQADEADDSADAGMPAAEPPARERPAAAKQEQPASISAAPAYEAPPPASSSAAPLVAPGEGTGPDRQRRRTILIVSIILLLCCCCVFLISGYFVWGDPLLDLLIDMGLMNWLRDLGIVI